ncbi:MAG TPA: TolC family protein [Flavisolibacter sp.]|jgi:outer membrane protein TolC|nr:TolC family protein [Flavisolibacter sp.]
MKRISAWLLSCLAFLSLEAQQRDPDTLPVVATLEQCIQFALKHQPLIAQAQLDEQITEANIRGRLADWYPQIGASYTLQHNFQRQTSFFNGAAVPVGVANTSTAQLSLSQAIFNRDVLLANRTQGDVRLQTRQNTAARKIDIAAAVSKAFYDVLTTQQQIKVAAENILRLQRSLNDAYYRYQVGVTDKTDYKRAQITLNNTTAAKQANEAALVAKVEYLKNLMGYPVTRQLTVAYDSLQMERDVVFDTLQRPDFSQRIEYSQLVTQKRLQEANLVYQRNSFLPTVSANAIYNLNYLDNSFGKLYGTNYPNSFVGITAGIPIFQGGKSKANVRAAQLQLARVDLDIINLENAINSQYVTALGNYKGALAAYRASKENVALAEEVYAVIQLQYKAGVKTYLEVITSETDLRTAQINYFNALNQVLASKVDAERALGTITF